MRSLDHLSVPWPMDTSRIDIVAPRANERSRINNESPPQWVVTIEPVSRLMVKFELKYNNDEDSKQEVPAWVD